MIILVITVDKDPTSSNGGIKIDHDNPDEGWKDLKGQIVPRVGGGAAPTLAAFRGANILSYAFGAADVIDQIVFHMPHDYKPGTHMFLHVHWAHNGTAISGNFVIDWYYQYAKGYEQAAFNAQVNYTQTIACDIGTYPQYYRNISEFQCTVEGGSGNQLDTNDMEVDGIWLIALNVTGIPTITGGTPNQPFIFSVDLHYQSTGVPTKDKNAPFYS